MFRYNLMANKNIHFTLSLLFIVTLFSSFNRSYQHGEKLPAIRNNALSFFFTNVRRVFKKIKPI